MDFNDETSKVSKYFKTGANTLIKESQKLLEISRLNLEILSMGKEVNSLYLELAKHVYSEYSHHHTIPKNLIKYCEKISELNENISKAEKNISKIKST